MESGVETANTLNLVFSLLALSVSLGTLFYTVRQVRLLRSQLQIDADLRIAEVNRELLKMAFQDTELFDLFDDKPLSNKRKERHYLQMWFNHIHTMWNAHEHGLVSEAEWYSNVKDISVFFSINLVKKYWEESKCFFPASFVEFITSLKIK